MSRLYSNNYSTTLNGAINDTTTTIIVTSVTGLPTVGGGDTCRLTIDDGTNIEIVQVTSNASTTLTVVRGQEGTSGTAFADLDAIELRSTAASFIDPNGVIDFGGATSLEIPNGAAPTVTVNGHIVLDTTVTDFSHGIMKYYGGEEMAIISVPIAELTSPTDGHVVSYNATNDEFELAAAGGGIANIVEDVTPQLGGALDVNGKQITSVSATDIELHSDNDVNIILGDAAGVDDLNIKDSAGVTVASVNSDGDADFTGLTLDSPLPVAEGGTGQIEFPKFRAYLNVAQTIATATITKIQYDTEIFDTAGDYDPTTNYRFTPSVAGKYLVTANAYQETVAAAYTSKVMIYKNTAEVARTEGGLTFVSGVFGLIVTDLIDMNGTTDYLEIHYEQNSGGTRTLTGDTRVNYFTAHLVV